MSKQRNIFLRVDGKHLVTPVFIKIKPIGDKELTLDRIDFLRESIATEYRAKTKKVREISKEYYNAQKAFNKAGKKLDEARLLLSVTDKSSENLEEIEAGLYYAIEKYTEAEANLTQRELMEGFNHNCF